MKQFKKEHQLDGSYEVIAMQIRRGTEQTSFVKIATEKEESMFWRCAKMLSKSEEVEHFMYYSIKLNVQD